MTTATAVVAFVERPPLLLSVLDACRPAATDELAEGAADVLVGRAGIEEATPEVRVTTTTLVAGGAFDDGGANVRMEVKTCVTVESTPDVAPITVSVPMTDDVWTVVTAEGEKEEAAGAEEGAGAEDDGGGV